jgi:hypothetical protein
MLYLCLQLKTKIVMKSDFRKQQIKDARRIERELQIELGMNFNRHRVHESKKTYNRKQFKIKQDE